MKKIIIALITIFISTQVHADDKATIKTVYDTIIKKHVNPISAETLSLAGLKGIKDLDKDLTFADGKDYVYLYYKGNNAGMWRRPKDKNNLDEWAEIHQKVIDVSKKKSKKIDNIDYKISEVIILSAVQSLNDGSKYYSELEDMDEPRKRKVKHFAQRVYGDVLYLKIGSFNDYTKDNIEQAINERPQAKAIVLDLRGNQGGVLNAAIEVAKLFIDDGIIVSVRGKENNTVKYYNASNGKTLNLPIAVLIDADTASSAEVLAAALQEQIQAKLVGTPTFGKGSVQEMYSFENGGKLAITNAFFYTPSGYKIDQVGLKPDYCTYRTVKVVDNVASYANLVCSKESREGNEADLEIAVSLLKNEIE